MRNFENENNVDILKQYIVLQEATITQLTERLNHIHDQKFNVEQIRLSLEDQLLKLKKTFFISGQERLDKKLQRDRRLEAHQGVLLHSEGIAPKPLESEKSELKTIHIGYVYPTNAIGELLEECGHISHCECGGVIKKKESVVSWKQISVRERIYQQEIIEQSQYQCECCKKVITAPGPERVKQSCPFSIEMAVQVVGDKFQHHLPLERQRRMMEAAGFEIDVKQLWRLSCYVYEIMLHITRMILREIKRDKLPVHIDESTWPVQDDGDGYMWIFSNRSGSYYQYEPTRSGKIPVEVMKKFKGITLTDGYGGYNRLIKDEALKNGIEVKLSYCWSHVRRHFFELIDNYPQCVEIVEWIDEMFRTERGAKDFAELKRRRILSSKIVVERIHAWLKAQMENALSESLFMKAIGYTMKLWPGLTLFLEDSHIPLSNNQAERDIRQAVMGRKNFYGSKSIDGADQAACFYTIIETCKKMELSPTNYMIEMMKRNWRKEKLLTPYQYAVEIRKPNQENLESSKPP